MGGGKSSILSLVSSTISFMLYFSSLSTLSFVLNYSLGYSIVYIASFIETGFLSEDYDLFFSLFGLLAAYAASSDLKGISFFNL